MENSTFFFLLALEYRLITNAVTQTKYSEGKKPTWFVRCIVPANGLFVFDP